jgi:oligogalacturonide lyase
LLITLDNESGAEFSLLREMQKVKTIRSITIISILLSLTASFYAEAQIGTRFPSERKIITDPHTGIELTFLTSTPAGDSKIYQTHNQWTSDGEWLIFRSRRVRGEAMAVHEKTGVLMQVTEGGYSGMLNVARKSMHLYFMRRPLETPRNGAMELIEVDLAKLFNDSEAGTLKPSSEYQRVCGITPSEWRANGNMALDSGEEWAWFQVGRKEAHKHLPEETKIEPNFGPRHMGAGPGGIGGMNLRTGECKYVISVPFQVGHIQSNPWVPGQIVFCWETGGKSPQRTWIVNSDGTGLRPLYPEASYEWVTHEAVIGPEEIAIAIMGHRDIPGTSNNAQVVTNVNGANPGQEPEWGNCGTREKPTGLGIVNIKTREMEIVGQTPEGSGLWHVHGSSDGRFAVGDDFARNIYLINRNTREMFLLSTGHKTTASDHPHPTFSPTGDKIEIQSAMLSEDNRSMNICIIPVLDDWLE